MYLLYSIYRISEKVLVFAQFIATIIWEKYSFKHLNCSSESILNIKRNQFEILFVKDCEKKKVLILCAVSIFHKSTALNS